MTLCALAQHRVPVRAPPTTFLRLRSARLLLVKTVIRFRTARHGASGDRKRALPAGEVAGDNPDPILAAANG